MRRVVPLSAFATYAPNSTATSINHQGQSVATTISFNLAPGQSLSDAQAAIARRRARSRCLPPSTARSAAPPRCSRRRCRNQPILILAALVAVYIVLGVLYESYIHPITVLSTLPSAGIGAVGR